jgi:putative DNA methylase
LDNNGRRLIEDYIPIEAISAEARQENSVTQAKSYLSKALLSVLHRWWARRPLTASRAAVYGALVPAPTSASSADEELEFVSNLCRWKAPKRLFRLAADRIKENYDVVPRVLDMFGGGGSIPLEAARLGCEAHSIELNPVAYIVELATLVYPPTYGTQLVAEVRQFSRRVFEGAQAELQDVYPRIADPKKPKGNTQTSFPGPVQDSPEGLVPVAYLWTRTVPCMKPDCKASVPLHRSGWMKTKAGSFVAVKPTLNRLTKTISYPLFVSSAQEADDAIAEWGFSPDDLSSRGETSCPFCHSPVSGEHVRASGNAGRLGLRMMGVVALRRGERGKVYVGAPVPEDLEPNDAALSDRLEKLLRDLNLSIPSEPLREWSGVINPPLYGLRRIDQLFTKRQLVMLFTFVKHIRRAHEGMLQSGIEPGRARAIATYLALIFDRVAERSCTITEWDIRAEFIQESIGKGRLQMTWDFPELNPFSGSSGSWEQAESDALGVLEALVADGFRPCTIQRGSAMALPYDDKFFDAIVTDPPYYFNVPYSYLADFFLAWMKRNIGHLYPEHFAGVSSPTKAEAIMDPPKFGGDRGKAHEAYESMMAEAFREANRVLKPGAPMVCVYAHKTTAGWGTFVGALRKAGFIVSEAWPLDTENPTRTRSKSSAALASSIFLVARRREGDVTGSYEQEVQPELQAIVEERVTRLWKQGITGADLVIACVGAGLRAFTRFARVEYSNGDEVPAERFLTEVETVVLECILARLSEEVGGRSGRYVLAGVDAVTRFYTLWRYTYRAAELEGGDAIIFANGTHVELDGLHGLSAGSRPLVKKKKGNYVLLDYSERGDDATLGITSDDGQPVPLIDSLHRLLWLMERHPSGIPDFLREARPNTEQLRLIAQALAGPALKGGELCEVASGSELAALTKLTANWRNVVDEGPLFKAARQRE